MSNQFLQRVTVCLGTCAVIAFAVGCEQQRYQPAAWQPGTSSTLPAESSTSEDLASALQSGTLAARPGSSLPVDFGAVRIGRTTLAYGTTLAARNLSSDSRASDKKPPLPDLTGKQFWDTSPKKNMGPVRGKPGLYLNSSGFQPFAQPNSGTSPTGRSGLGTTLPDRNGFGTTLPDRGWGGAFLGGSTLPVDGATLPLR